MECKVRTWHFELEKAEFSEMESNITYKKVDDSLFRKVNIYWDETMYISAELKEQVISDIENTIYMRQMDEISIKNIEYKLNNIIRLLFNVGKLSTRPGDGEQLVLQKEPMYEYY